MTRYADYRPRFSSDADEVAWVCSQLDAALDGYDAAWLTPLLTEPDVAEVLLSYPAEQFVVIGSSDPYLSQEVLDALPGQRLVVPGDHILRVPGDAVAMVASHDHFVRAFDAWLAASLS